MYPDALAQVYQRQAEWNRAFAMNCIDLGVDMVHVSDDWGGQRGLLFSPRTWWKLIYPNHEITCRAVQARGVPTRVVSVPCWSLFEQQDAAYQASVIGRGTVRVAIEAGVKQGWERFIGEDGAFIGMTGFGASAPAEVLYEKFGITADAVLAAVRTRLQP